MAENDLDARVLVCDPDNKILADVVRTLHGRFGEGELPEAWNITTMRSFGTFAHGRVEYTLVDDVESAAEEIKQRSPFDPPYYSLIVYEACQVEREVGSVGDISKVNKHDFFMSQMVVGEDIGRKKLIQSARAGAIYSTENIAELRDELSNIFRRPQQISNLTIVKFGGSSDDFDRDNRDKKNLLYVCEILWEIQDESYKSRKSPHTIRIIGTAGAGQRGNIAKDRAAKYPEAQMIQAEFPKRIATALEENLNEIHGFFYDAHTGKFKSRLLNTGAFYIIDNKVASKKIPLIAAAPHYIMAKYRIPLQDSDTHTVALADFYGAERVILIKRTDGIYDYDPMRGFVLDQKTGECADLERWKDAQKDNRRYDVVTVDNMLNGSFSREGTGVDGEADGSTGHLIEDSALRFMQEHCHKVNEIVVVHIAPEEMYYPIGGNGYRHIVTGEEITLSDTGWHGVLEQNIRNAFNGMANSRIVK